MPLRPTLCLVFGLVVLTGCATPQDTCEADARRELDLIDALIAETELSIERGYRIEREPDVRNVLRLCLEPGALLPVCTGRETTVRDRPIGIFRAEERQRLESLKERRRELVGPTQTALAACALRNR
jgi:hypothetical protein